MMLFISYFLMWNSIRLRHLIYSWFWITTQKGNSNSLELTQSWITGGQEICSYQEGMGVWGAVLSSDRDSNHHVLHYCLTAWSHLHPWPGPYPGLSGRIHWIKARNVKFSVQSVSGLAAGNLSQVGRSHWGSYRQLSNFSSDLCAKHKFRDKINHP